MKLQLKRSNVFTGTTSPVRAQVPTPPTTAQTLDGELCVNYNDGDPALFVRADAGAIVRVDGNYKAYDLDVGTITNGAKIDLVHKSSGLNDSTVEHTVNFTGGTGVTITESATDNIQISISGADDIGVNLGVTRAETTNEITNTAGRNATLQGASGTEAGLLIATDKDKLDNIESNAEVNVQADYTETDTSSDAYIQNKPSWGRALTNNSNTINADIATEGSLGVVQVGNGLDITTDGLLSFDGTEINSGIDLKYTGSSTNGVVECSAGNNATIPAAAVDVIGLIEEPNNTADDTTEIYVRQSVNVGGTQTYSWVADAGGDLTGIDAGDGIVVTDGDTATPTVSVDLATNQGLEFDSSSPGDLQIISGNDPQDTLLWTADGGARTITAAGASGASTEPEGDYVNVATTGTGSGCTVNFTVAATTGVISNLIIANPGSNYPAGDTLTIVGHETSVPDPITFTLETSANDGVWTYTGWRTGAITVGSAGGGGGDISGIDGGQGISIDESDTTTPEINIDLALNSGLEFVTEGTDDKLRVDAHNGIEVTGDGVSTRIHTGGGLSDTLATNELGIIDGTNSNQTLVWKGQNRVATISVEAANNTSSQDPGEYSNVATVADGGSGSGLIVSFTVAGDNTVADASISIVNPGIGYTATDVVSVSGHGDLNFVVDTITAAAEWVVEDFTPGTGGGGDLTGIDAGPGITVTEEASTTPKVEVDIAAGLGLAFSTATDAGELQIQNGTSSNQLLVWKGADRVNAVDIDAGNNASDQDPGRYQNVSTTADSAGGTGLTITFTVADDNTVSSATVVNPGQGYTDGETISVDGHGDLNVTVDGVTAATAWVVESSTGNGPIEIPTVQPPNPDNGQLWWNTDDNTLYVWYVDGDTSQWVIAVPQSVPLGVATDRPSSPVNGQLWWNTNNNTLYIWYEDGDTGQWVIATPSGGASSLQEVTDVGNNTDNNITLGTDRIVLNADGSANFRRTVDLFDAGGTERAIRLQPRFGGFIEIISSGANDDATVFQAIPDASANLPNVKFTKGGHAEFAGVITANSGNHALGTVYFFDNLNAIDVKRRVGPTASSSGSLPLYIGNSRISTTTFYEIWTEPDNPANYTTTTEEYEEQEEVTPYVPAVPATYDEYGNELTAEVPEVPATYQTVTKTREISTYTGPTLDVKERLTKADNALIALKSAAAAATDFAELKAAITTALADI